MNWTDDSRLIDYSNLTIDNALEGLKYQIVRRLKKRKRGMTPKEVCRWFAATPDEFVFRALESGIEDGVIQRSRVGEAEKVTRVWVDEMR